MSSVTSGGIPNQEPRGIKRIQQACSNCRRKKAKCSGERPICGHCKRLAQDCQWESASGARSSVPSDQQNNGGARAASASESANGSGSGIDPGNASCDDGLSVRVAAIESKLDLLMNTINTFLPALIHQRDAGLLPSPGDSSFRRTETPIGRASPARDVNAAFDPESTSKSLPPSAVLSSLVNTYFARVQNQPYTFFHEQNFRQRLNDGLLPDYLIYAVLASALRFSGDPYYHGAGLEATAVYAKESWKQIVSSWFATESDPDIYICQTITLLSIIDFAAGRRHPAWLKIGLSIRIAQDLCLMMEPNISLSYADQEERRRVFWSIYVLDKLCSCGRAQPAAIADRHCLVQLPCDEITFRNGAWKKMPRLDQIFSASDSTTVHSGHLALVVLVACIVGRCAQHSIHESSKDESWLPPWDSKSDFATIYSILLQLETQFEMGESISEALQRDCLQEEGLDMQIAGPLVFSHAVFHVSQCILHHPFLLSLQLKRKGIKAPPSFLNRALQTCREHAYSLSELLRQSRQAGCTVYYSFMGYCATVSGGVHTMFVNNADVSIRQQARDCLLSDTAFLGELSRFWKSGKEMSAILQNLTVKSMSSTSLVTSPDSEALDDNMLANLWAAVDYTTMCQSPKSPTSLGGFDASLDLDTIFGVTSPDGSQSRHYLPSQVGLLSEPSPYPNLMFDGMSPITSFFGSSSMNFGG